MSVQPRVTLFVTCMIDIFTPDVAVAAVKVLRAGGAEVSCPSGQTCCGQPAWNSGFAADAAKVAGATLAALEADGGDVIVVPSGSCATMIKVFWPQMFTVVGDELAADRARRIGERVVEFGSYVAEHKPALCAGDSTAAYHHSCHMLRELRIREQPLELLDDAGVQVSEWAAAERCCGFGGLFSFKLPEVAEAMADDKLASLATIDPPVDIVVGSDTSCLAHLSSRAAHEGFPIRTRHLAEVLADALAPDLTGEEDAR
jgi:L-lactate dehydrogenase complex protein LldE